MNTRAISIIFELTAGKFVKYFNALIKLAMFQQDNYSQPLKSLPHLTCAYKHQKVSGRSRISWLLILIMITGPLQASFAAHSNLNTHDRETQTLVVQFQETAVDSEEHHCIAGYCQPLSACTTHFTCTPINLTNPPLLSVQIQIYHHHLIADVEVSTRFPDPLKRPPRPETTV